MDRESWGENKCLLLSEGEVRNPSSAEPLIGARGGTINTLADAGMCVYGFVQTASLYNNESVNFMHLICMDLHLLSSAHVCVCVCVCVCVKSVPVKGGGGGGGCVGVS